uniref:Uncharacterized protein n=1 Tax=Branchiostoma floridae TaxID=7739 RepID=C3ZI80_BRAFL|eukprot:XP_002591811.1 hypothetical protein BRAFLDRAFT_83599 [Branchiostoma floridae]
MRYGNLRGFMLFNLDQSREAEKSFRKVLEVDPSNLNAIGNLVVLYEEQFMYAKAREMHAKLKALLKEGGNNGEARQARATAEQLFAYRRHPMTWRNFHIPRYEMQQVHLRAMKGRGDHVIAILYKPCEVPDDIAHLTYLPCKTDGQLGPDGWRRLEDALTDSDDR